MKKNILLLLLAFSLQSFSQTSTAEYTAVIVPYKFDFLDEPNQFQLNILARVLLQEKGFQVYMDVEEKPLSILSNSCKTLEFQLDEIQSFLRKRLQFKLIDCSGNVVYTSEVGQSNEKKFKKSYSEALKECFLTFAKTDINNDFLIQMNPSETSKASELDNKVKQSDSKFNDKQTYKFAGQTYWLVKVGKNYELYLTENETLFAQLEKADKGTYIYKSGDLLGAAYFSPQGDLTVEYKEENSEAISELNFIKI